MSVAAKLHSNAKANAKRRGVDFDLTLEWVEEHLAAGVCEATGVPFDYTKHATRLRPLAPSIDRVTGWLGYTEPNCRIVATAFNIAKSDFGEPVFSVIAREYTKRNPS